MATKGISGVQSTYTIDYDTNPLFRPGKESAEQIQKMLEQDANLAEAINAYHETINGTEFLIQSESEEEVELYEEMFFRNPKFSWTDFIDKAFTAIEYGHSLHEYELKYKDGKAHLYDLQFREQKTLVKWKINKNKLEYIEQQGYDGDKYSTVKLNSNLLLLAFGKGTSANFGGRSILRAIYKAWKMKQDLLLINFLIQDKYALPTPVIHTNGMEDPNKATLRDAAQAVKAGASNYIELDDMGEDTLRRLTFLEATIPDTKILDFIKLLDNQISRGTATMHLAQGNLDSGSRAVGEVQERRFYEKIESYLKQGVETFNRVILERLNNLNGTNATLEFVSPVKADLREKIELAKIAVESGLIESGESDSEFYRNLLELPEFIEKTTPDTEENSIETDTNEIEEDTGEEEESQMSENPKVFKFAEQEAVKNAMSRVDFEAHRIKLNQAEEGIKEAYDEMLKEVRMYINLQINKGVSPTKIDVKASISNRVKNNLIGAYMDMFNYGKKTQADEIGARAPKTDTKTERSIKMKAEIITDKIISDLVFTAQNNLIDNAQLPEGELQSLVDRAMQKKSDSISVVAAGGISLFMNWGRGFTQAQNKERIVGYLYSAKLDSRTTDYCRLMNGIVTSAGSTTKEEYPVNAHPNCRSMWVAIKKTDGEINTVDDIGQEREEFLKKQTTLEQEKDKFTFSEPIDFDEIENTFLTNLIEQFDSKE